MIFAYILTLILISCPRVFGDDPLGSLCSGGCRRSPLPSCPGIKMCKWQTRAN